MDDDLTYSVVRTSDIRETDDYPGIRVHIKADYLPLSMPLTVDVTTGDRIVPAAVRHTYKLTFDGAAVDVVSYPTATVLAEKLETVLSRGITNTRPRDFYDIHMLWWLRRDDFTLGELSEALEATAEKRHSTTLLASWRETLQAIQNDKTMLAQWSTYARRFQYIGNLTLEETCETILEVMTTLEQAGYRGAAIKAVRRGFDAIKRGETSDAFESIDGIGNKHDL